MAASTAAPVGVAVVAAAPARTSSSAARVATPAPRPVAAPARSRATVPPADEDDGLGALYELAEQAKSAEPAAGGPRCRQCKSPLDDAAVLCTNCGFNTRTGKAVSMAPMVDITRSTLSYATPAAALATKKPGQVDLMAPQGSFMLGLGLSVAFALVASLLWIVVAWVTGYAIGYIAIAIGAAAGAGMKIGQKGFSSTGGWAAAGICVGSILFAKVMVLEIFLSTIGHHRSIFELNGSRVGLYLFSPMSMIFMLIGMGAAFRTASGSVSN